MLANPSPAHKALVGWMRSRYNINVLDTIGSTVDNYIIVLLIPGTNRPRHCTTITIDRYSITFNEFNDQISLSDPDVCSKIKAYLDDVIIHKQSL